MARSVLGSPIFNIFVNDLFHNVKKATLWAYAADKLLCFSHKLKMLEWYMRYSKFRTSRHGKMEQRQRSPPQRLEKRVPAIYMNQSLMSPKKKRRERREL